MESKTIDYYNQVAKSYVENTINVNFSERQNKFIDLLHEDSIILDFGCGSGRDSKYFIDHGFRVIAVDGSEEMVKLASDYTGLNVIHSSFQEFEFTENVDAVWACSSLLHVESEELAIITTSIYNHLNNDGLIYLSFKYGDFEGFRRGRIFNDMNEIKFERFMKANNLDKKFSIISDDITSDVRQGRANEKWLNLILRKR